jgi:hypothetical protein
MWVPFSGCPVCRASHTISAAPSSTGVRRYKPVPKFYFVHKSISFIFLGPGRGRAGPRPCDGFGRQQFRERDIYSMCLSGCPLRRAWQTISAAPSLAAGCKSLDLSHKVVIMLTVMLVRMMLMWWMIMMLMLMLMQERAKLEVEGAVRQGGTTSRHLAHLLAGNQIGAAVALAASIGDVRLAAVICQVGCC